MAKTKEQKAVIEKKLKDAFQNAASTAFVHFKGLSVADESEMRNKMKQENLRYFVAKKTLIRRALGESGIKGDIPSLEGEVAVAYNEPTQGGAESDPTAPARAVHTFAKQFGNEKLSIVGGIFENTFKDQAAMNEIATIPPIEGLRGMFVNIINSPVQRMAIALGQIAQKKA